MQKTPLKNSIRKIENHLNLRLKSFIKMVGVDAVASVFLSDNDEMREMKQRYTGKKAPIIVDVLAFEEPKGFPNPDSKKKVLGEIFINKKIAEREPERAVFLVIHGLLHLLGYTHSKKSDTLKMEKLEGEILSCLKIKK